ncbi:hypothetical protein [Photorhabdus heterorhabditis]|uniref:hypothetical protein n=1 Tax=Photorhabdus heterorhabditis TaxID=880156 RepID=UPI0020B74DE5|nr:hypothetical protein [Photorhabdus heterorhabditis]
MENASVGNSEQKCCRYTPKEKARFVALSISMQLGLEDWTAPMLARFTLAPAFGFHFPNQK